MLNPWSRDKLRARGDAARDARNWQEAAEHYAQYLALKPNDAAIWVQLGHCRKEHGDREEAERAYLRALTLEPNNADTHVQIGHIEKLKGSLDEALSWYRKALAIDATFEPAIQEAGDTESALAAMKRSQVPKTSELDVLVAAAVEKQIAPLRDQINAVRAIAVELQRVRQRTEAAEARVTEVAATAKALEAALRSLKDEQTARLGVLEAKSPLGQTSFPALLTRLSEINAHRAEVEQCRGMIEKLEQRLNGLHLQH